MFAPPNVRSDKGWPADQIQPMQRYTLTLVDLVDEGVSQFAKDKNAADAPHSIRWDWTIHDSDGVPILDDDDALWIYKEWTSNKTGYQNDGTPSKARARLDALVGRALSDEEVTRVPTDKLKGRRASAIFHMVKRTNGEGQEVLRPAVLTIAPYKEPVAAAPAPKAAAAAANGKPSAEPEPRPAEEFTFS